MKKSFLAAAAIVVALAGCGGAAAPEPKTFDLGLEPPSSALPAVRVGSVRAAAPFDGTDMQFRLAYRNAAEIAPFANSRWAATPAEMFRKQLQRASRGDGKCTLSVEIQEFTQVFAAQGQSAARIELRGSVGAASRQFTVVENNAGANAEGGAAALARASNRAIGEIADWIGSQPGCR